MAEPKVYRPCFSERAVSYFIILPRRGQRKLLDRAHELAADPFLPPDYHSADADGQEISHLVVEDFAFSYWVDHAVRLVMITDIVQADAP